MISLFVALSGVAYAATLAKNSVGSKQIEKNAVRSGEIQNGAVASKDLKDSSVASIDVLNGTLTGDDVEDESLDAVEILNDSLRSEEILDGTITGTDIQEGSVQPGDLATGLPPQAFARVQADGTLQPDVADFPSQVRAIDPGDVVKGEAAAATGTYCFGDLPFQPASAMIALDNADAAAADRNLVTSVAIDRGPNLGDCPPTHQNARVRIVDGNTEAATDARFYIWFLR